MKRTEILRKFGPKGITQYAPAYGGIGRITDDTQMTLFTAEGLIRAWVRGCMKGITTYSPLRHWKVGPGMKVGIIGLGGLGHMGVKFAKAFGAHVVLFTTSPKKVS